ncbi:MAG: aminopeptidase P family N-terminal domain-containing protein, partial [Candidatus Gallimonas sp.]
MLTERLSKIYRAAGADALYTTTDYLRRYLTGFYSTDGFVLIDGERRLFVTDSRYVEAAEKALDGSGIEVRNGSYALAEQLLSGYRTVAVPFELTSVTEYRKLEALGVQLKD